MNRHFKQSEFETAASKISQQCPVARLASRTAQLLADHAAAEAREVCTTIACGTAVDLAIDQIEQELEKIEAQACMLAALSPSGALFHLQILAAKSHQIEDWLLDADANLDLIGDQISQFGSMLASVTGVLAQTCAGTVVEATARFLTRPQWANAAAHQPESAAG